MTRAFCQHTILDYCIQTEPAPHGTIEFCISEMVTHSSKQASVAVSQAQWPELPSAVAWRTVRIRAGGGVRLDI